MKIINRTVLVLSLVSLFADMASEMLYPIIPVYLREIGFSVLLIGLLEGVAGFTAGLTKGYFGKWSDTLGRRIPFIQWGYLLSALSKPMMGLLSLPLWVFFSRTLDRLGKGLRTAPRDALLAQQATPQTSARVFGFHRGMDTLGATIGPALALLLLWMYPGNYRLLFWLAFLPGLASVLLILLLREKPDPEPAAKRGGFFSFFSYWKKAAPGYRRLVPGLLLFALFNSSDALLLLRTREITGDDRLTIGAYIFYNLVFAAMAYPMGMIADRIGKRQVLVGGFCTFAIVYALFAAGTASTVLVFGAFLLYGLYAAATEGVAKAWLSSCAPTEKGTALGFYSSCESICALAASVIAGFTWTRWGALAAFSASAVAALVAALYLLIIRPQAAP